MKKIATLLFVAISTINTYAQNNTMGSAVTAENNGKSKVLIIPFEPKLYISDIDNQLAKENEMNFQDIKAKFRAALDQNIFISLKEYYSPLSFYMIPEQDAIKELSYIYNSIGYKYEVMPEEEVVEKESAGKKLMGKFKKSKRSGDPELDSGTEEEYEEAKIQNGQIVSQVDNREKYMQTSISNDNLIPTLNQQYQARYYLFVNELDIKRAVDEQQNGGLKENYQREIKVHYTIFDHQENRVSSGAIKALFDSRENDVEKIIKTQFALISNKLVEKLTLSNITEAKE